MKNRDSTGGGTGKIWVTCYIIISNENASCEWIEGALFLGV
jgi:hypothetical protein